MNDSVESEWLKEKRVFPDDFVPWPFFIFISALAFALLALYLWLMVCLLRNWSLVRTTPFFANIISLFVPDGAALIWLATKEIVDIDYTHGDYKLSVFVGKVQLILSLYGQPLNLLCMAASRHFILTRFTTSSKGQKVRQNSRNLLITWVLIGCFLGLGLSPLIGIDPEKSSFKFHLSLTVATGIVLVGAIGGAGVLYIMAFISLRKGIASIKQETEESKTENKERISTIPLGQNYLARGHSLNTSSHIPTTATRRQENRILYQFVIIFVIYVVYLFAFMLRSNPKTWRMILYYMILTMNFGANPMIYLGFSSQLRSMTLPKCLGRNALAIRPGF